MEKLFSGDAAKWLIEEAAKRGVTLERVLRHTGLGEAWLQDPGAVLDAGQYRQLVLNALEECRDPTLGLCAARQPSYVSRFGFWGYAIMSSANWEQASGMAIRYWQVSGSLVRLRFFRQGDACGWEIYPNLEPRHEKILIFGVEKVLSSALATIEFATGSPAPLREIQVSYAPPEHAVLYRDYWKAPVRFGCARSLALMDASVLERPILMANPQIMEVCQEQCRGLLANLRKSDELVELIRRIIIACPGDFPAAPEMAAKLSLSPRTFRRRLEERGTTYLKVLDEVRAELAMSYLISTNLSIDEIASLLGYAETTTFRRTFKKWVGRSASQVRKANQRTPGGR